MIGSVKNEVGLLFSQDTFKTVKKQLHTGETIQAHNHPEATVVFIVLNGTIKVQLDAEETHILTAGDVLSFDGIHTISALAQTDCEIIVTLVKK